jgi:amino acid transporter
VTLSNGNASALRKAGLLSLVFVMFSYTTGGPFGLEDMVTTSGPGMTLIFLLVLPFFWCVPVSLVAAELTTAMPVEGGFYRWTRAAFGDFWGFLAGWWNWSASFLLGGAYAVLFTDYLAAFFPSIGGWKHYVVSVGLIALITWVNVRGIRMVGKVATALEVCIFLPVIVMVAMGLVHWRHKILNELIREHWVWLYRFRLRHIFYLHWRDSRRRASGRIGIPVISQTQPRSSEGPGWAWG